MKTLSELLMYLKDYDRPCELIEDTDECKTVIENIECFLDDYPDYMYRLKGPYQLNSFRQQEYALFYINDMILFKKLLDQKRYYSFIHEVYDFMRFKIFKDDISSRVTLPCNIKYALIHIIETSLRDV